MNAVPSLMYSVLPSGLIVSPQPSPSYRHSLGRAGRHDNTSDKLNTGAVRNPF
jgi:hypothetical protein